VTLAGRSELLLCDDRAGSRGAHDPGPAAAVARAPGT